MQGILAAIPIHEIHLSHFLLLVFITTFLTAGGPLPEGPQFAHQKLKEPVFPFQLDVSPPFAYCKQPSQLSLGLREDVNDEERNKSLKIGPSLSLFCVTSHSPLILRTSLLFLSSAASFVCFSHHSFRVFKAPDTFLLRAAGFRQVAGASSSFFLVCFVTRLHHPLGDFLARAFFLCYEIDLSLPVQLSKHSVPLSFSFLESTVSLSSSLTSLEGPTFL